MHVLVASSGNAMLETALTRAGHRVSLLVPADTVEQRRADTPQAEGVYGISRWHEPGALSPLLPHLPTDLDRVASIDEQAIARPCAVIRERLGLPGLTLSDALAHTDKDIAKSRLGKAGIPVARHRLVRSGADVGKAGDELGWPVVVKPARGAGATATFVVEDRAHLQRLIGSGAFDQRVADSTGRFAAGEFLLSLNERGGFVVEEYLAVTEEWFVDLYLHEGQVLAAFPGRYSAPLLGALGAHQWDAVVPAGHHDARTAIKLAVRAARVLGSGTGVVHCEILRIGKGRHERWFFGEAAHRPGGGGIFTLYGRQHGLDLPPILAALAVGERPDIPLDPAPPTMANLLLAAPTGTVRSVATTEELLRCKGVLDAQVNLRPGRPTPGGFGTMSLAGTVTLHAADLDQVAQRCAAVIDTLALEVTEPQTLVTGCVR